MCSLSGPNKFAAWYINIYDIAKCDIFITYTKPQTDLTAFKFINTLINHVLLIPIGHVYYLPWDQPYMQPYNTTYDTCTYIHVYMCTGDTSIDFTGIRPHHVAPCCLNLQVHRESIDRI